MRFDKLRKYLNRLPEMGLPMCDCIVYREHKVLFRHMAGFRDLKKTQPVSDDDRYWYFSAGKVITCTAAMQLIERGALKLTDPVYKYLPAFRNMTVMHDGKIRPVETEMTVWNLFTMTGGINFEIDGAGRFLREKHFDPEASTIQAVSRIAAEPLAFDPGKHYHYGYEHDVLGAVIEAVSGKILYEYLNENVFIPLGIKNMSFFEHAQKDKISEFYVYRDGRLIPDMQAAVDYLAFLRHYQSGGGGIIGTVSDYGLFADALANGGTGATGNKILSQESIDRMRTNQLDGCLMKEYLKGPGNYGYGYGLGVRTLISQNCNNYTSKSPVGEFGWGGASGTYSLIDPENHISIFYAQHSLNSPCSFSYQDHPHNMVRDLVYEALEK